MNWWKKIIQISANGILILQNKNSTQNIVVFCTIHKIHKIANFVENTLLFIWTVQDAPFSSLETEIKIKYTFISLSFRTIQEECDRFSWNFEPQICHPIFNMRRIRTLDPLIYIHHILYALFLLCKYSVHPHTFIQD